ncbi:VOC family protein [Phytomonospora endophytica]|uniref:Glyoxalase-like domain-containing protein n=1 Tax=Phytomonospora endophytica TaxID=714109 RepID=A0A841FPV0_9ACTN|nr:VOC family protein [Phytomonospora endophytica]MBB6037854.1 hypothetical protein [Phytomonospora endophytica]GIG68753.1 hypothetical protein Pen01_50480 [Phytomonospora endophytica]
MGVGDPHDRSVDFGLLVQKLDSGQPRVHLDVHTDDVDAEVARLEALGATRVRRVAHLWIVRDPAGLPFCVTTARPGELDETNSSLWE